MRKVFLIVFAVALSASGSYVQAAVEVVSPSNLGDWALYTTDSGGLVGTGGGTADFVVGPATPPLGVGSAHLSTPTGGGDQSAQLRNSAWAGTSLSALTSLSYSTYATDWNGAQLPYLTIWLDLDGNGSRDDRLWFEPAYSNGGYGNGDPNPQADVALNTWQTWDALNGMWYSDNQFGPGADAVTFATYLAANPSATIINDAAQGIGGIRVATGFASPGDNYNTYVDNFTIGTDAGEVTYNFEPLDNGVVPEPMTLAVWSVLSLCGSAVAWRAKRRQLAD